MPKLSGRISESSLGRPFSPSQFSAFWRSRMRVWEELEEPEAYGRLLRTEGVGRKTINEIRRILEAHEMKLGGYYEDTEEYGAWAERALEGMIRRYGIVGVNLMVEKAARRLNRRAY